MKIEMHTHTSESSPCARVSARQMVSLYQKVGYDAVVITDHFNKWAYEQSHTRSLEEYVEYVLTGYHTACEAAKNTSLLVLPGMEVGLLESPNDFLLYGMSEDFFREHPTLFTLSLKELSALCREHDILLFQAHPFRSYCSPSDPALLDGGEVFNGNPRHNNKNDQAEEWIRQNRLLTSSGSDFHEEEDLATGGIITSRQISNIRDLCMMLQDGDYQLLNSRGSAQK